MASTPLVTTKITVFDAKVRMKLAGSTARILANNRAMVKAMMSEIKPVVYVGTPLGPAHFGFHGRNTLTTKIESKDLRTTGELRAAVQLFWREFGTKRGERAFMLAHHAAELSRKLIIAFYGGKALWWRL